MCNDDRTLCFFLTIGTGRGKERPGDGGSARRVVARNTCAHTDRSITYRNLVDIDLIGIWDGPFRLGIEEDLDCHPS